MASASLANRLRGPAPPSSSSSSSTSSASTASDTESTMSIDHEDDSASSERAQSVETASPLHFADHDFGGGFDDDDRPEPEPEPWELYKAALERSEGVYWALCSGRWIMPGFGRSAELTEEYAHLELVNNQFYI
ncbi:hypothetical protein JCM11641_001052, partial [Rhodosporidiobolus odoratus]